MLNRNNNNNNNEDVIVTVNNEDLDNMERIIVTNEINNNMSALDDSSRVSCGNCTTNDSSRVSCGNCTICLNEIIINDKIIKLSCNHIYHEECIITYLGNYSNKCPICRTEIGRPKYNID